jgi:putative ABC transport system permease protein
MMLLAGMKKAFVKSGDPLNVLVMRKGSPPELAGGFTKDKLPILTALPGIAKSSSGEPLVSGEWVRDREPTERRMAPGIRTSPFAAWVPMALELRKECESSSPAPGSARGQHEIVVSRSIHSRFAHTGVGTCSISERAVEGYRHL